MNITKIIRDEAANNSVIAVKSMNLAVSYRQLFADVDSLTKQLTALGINADDKVALLGGDSYLYIALSLAILELNAAVIPVPVNSTGDEIEDILAQMKVRHLLFMPQYYSAKHAVRIKTPETTEDQYFLATLNAKKAQGILPKPLQAAFIRFSSGTTGQSKGVILSHRAIIERTDAANKALKISEDDNILWVLDMSFHFVVTILLFLRRRATIVLCGAPLPEKMAEALAHNKISVIYATAYHYRLMARFDSFTPRMLSSVRLAVATAMKLPADVARMFLEKFNFNLTQAYGIIEVGLPFVNHCARPEKSGSVGTILPDYQLKLRDCDAQQRGEIMLKGPGMFDAYFAPFTLAKDACVDSWFPTGDIGYLDADGYLFIAGRSKNVINFIGMKIFPYEVEKVISAHPQVLEVKVEGRLHESFGEIPVAFIVREPEYNKPQTQLAQELRKFCIRHLASYCVPKDFIFVPELEKTKSGKILRKKQ